MTDTTATTTAVDTAPAASQKRRGRPFDANSGLSKARALLASLPADTKRADAVAKFQSDCNLSKDTAAAYYSLLNRKA